VSIFGKRFKLDENKLKHKPFCLSMKNTGKQQGAS